MTDWKKFWSEYPVSLSEHEFLRQVGHTVDGQPYSRAQFEAMIATIRRSLELRSTDNLLDVCCGNGVVTRELGGSCRRVMGVDFSAPLLDVARKYHGGANVSYRLMDALQLEAHILAAEGPFTRVLMYAALQHFQHQNLAPLLTDFLRHAAPGRIILVGGVLDAERKHLFLDTPEKQAMYRSYVMEGRDRLGTWWDKSFVRQVSTDLGLRCEIDDYSGDRPGGHYRFDVKLS